MYCYSPRWFWTLFAIAAIAVYVFLFRGFWDDNEA
ncbi:hypothetical protein KIPB_015542, partial [Kipferlia bialata]|eukprot:g15542.t1